MIRKLLAVFALWGLMTANAFAARPEAVVPTDPSTVLEKLPRGYSSKRMPPDLIPPLTYISDLLVMASSTGDARLASRADRYLQRYPKKSRSTELLHARAFSAQHRHDFTEALRQLDALVEIAPLDSDARFSRAQIFLVQGNIKAAGGECAVLALRMDAASGLLCMAALSFAKGELTSAAKLVDRWLQLPSSDKAVTRYAMVMRGEIASRAGDPAADGWFARALALGPADVRTLAPYARHLRASARPREVIALLADAPDNDSLHLQRALAANEARLPEAGGLIAAQARRYAVSHESGNQPELRDEAEFLLVLRHDPAAALAIAMENFKTQRDIEDVELLRRAAAAAGQPEALLPLNAWARSQHLDLPDLPARIN